MVLSDYFQKNMEVFYMSAKKTAVLLFDYFSNYEISIALSILYQSGRKYEVFCQNEEAISEEGLHVNRTKSFDELCIEEYDSLLIPGWYGPA